MSSLHWHSVLPSGAFHSSTLMDDLAPALELSDYFGKRSILLSPADCGASQVPGIREKLLQQAHTPRHIISLDEFSAADPFAELDFRDDHFAVVIDREPSAAAIERMISMAPQLERLSYVVVGRKDWRFKDTFRSLPHLIRSRVFLDFPVSIHHSDPFYSPAEVIALQSELRASCGLESIRSFCPHFRLRRELLEANVIAVSAPSGSPDQAPELSIVASDPDSVNQLAESDFFRKYAGRIELVVPRVIGQETKSIPPLPGAIVSYVWLHLEDSARPYREMRAHLRNWGARHSRAKSILFADGEATGHLDGALGGFFRDGMAKDEVLRSGLGLLVDADRFRASGGFDPLYFCFGLGNAEFLYRFLGGLRPEAEDGALAQLLQERIHGPHIGLGLKLFYHQYFDLSFFRFFSQKSSAQAQEGGAGEANSHLQNRLRYRVEQSRDAYISLYKASPKVAVHGNIQLLLKPYHWIKPHAWRLKMPVYPLVVKPYHRIKPNVWRVKMPYHRIKPNVWRVKMPVYPLVVKPFHLAKLHIWRLKILVTGPYHFLRLRVWKIKLAFFFVRGNLWRIKQAYYFFFRLFFPVRKVYYFCAYQYEKRILGLYGKQHQWGQR